jgi:hypothetical protein
VTNPVFPAEIRGWVADGGPEAYDTESIYAYIDGHAEVYMAYGMQRCISQRYAAPDGNDEIVVDLFEMASPADAFGVFSHDRAGEEVTVGQGGIYRLGWLSFWSGPWYGSVYAAGGDEASRDAVLAVAGEVAAGLPAGGEFPALVSALPEDGLETTSVCWLRSPQILNAHVFVGGENPFDLGPGVEAVVGRYERDGSEGHLVVVKYPSESAAEMVEHGARSGAAADGPEMLMGRDGAVVAAVVGAETGEWAEILLAETLGGNE